MIKIDLSSEDDLWKLFRATSPPEDGHQEPGERAQEFRYLLGALYDRKTKKTPSFKLTNRDRFYYLRSRSVEAVVRQSALFNVGRAMYARDQDLIVQYLGTGPEPMHGPMRKVTSK